MMVHTSKLLRLGATVIGHEKGTVVLHKGALKLVLRVLIDVFLVIGDDGLGNGLADGVHLRGLTTTRHADTDVNVGKFVGANDQEGFVDLLHPKMNMREQIGWGFVLFVRLP